MYYYPSSPIIEPAITLRVLWPIVSFIVALIGGAVLYFLFFKPNTKMPNAFLEWLKEFFNFHKMLIEDILKITYLVLVIFITLSSFSLITTSFVAFLAMLVIGNLVLRIVFELCLINIMIWKNTNEINKKMKK